MACLKTPLFAAFGSAYDGGWLFPLLVIGVFVPFLAVPAVFHDVAAAGETSRVYPLSQAWTSWYGPYVPSPRGCWRVPGSAGCAR